MERMLSKRIKELRTEKGLSLRGLSQETGISKSSIENWENNVSDISGDNLIILSNYFKVPAGYILGIED